MAMTRAVRVESVNAKREARAAREAASGLLSAFTIAGVLAVAVDGVVDDGHSSDQP